MDRIEDVELVKKAIEATKYSYVKYSNFPVGAALLTNKGIFLGANIENSSYSLCMCAERTAIFRAHMDGCTKDDYQAIAVFGKTEDYIKPCGACLQVMSEFFTPGTSVILVNKNGEYKKFKFSELLPHSFNSLI